MEFYDKYITRLNAKGTSPNQSEELRQEASQSLKEDSSERSLTLTGLMVAALLSVAQRQNPLERSMADSINWTTLSTSAGVSRR